MSIRICAAKGCGETTTLPLFCKDHLTSLSRMKVALEPGEFDWTQPAPAPAPKLKVKLEPRQFGIMHYVARLEGSNIVGVSILSPGSAMRQWHANSLYGDIPF